MNFDIDKCRYCRHIDIRRYSTEVHEMSEAYLTNWSFGGEIPDTRNCFHDTALREARIASDYHAHPDRGEGSAASARTGFVARLRLALGGPAATAGCSCPA